LGDKYIPRKGKSNSKYVDAMVSNIGNVFNMESETPTSRHVRQNTAGWNQDFVGLGKNPPA
jgi:hypothetical protein